MNQFVVNLKPEDIEIKLMTRSVWTVKYGFWVPGRIVRRAVYDQLENAK